MILVCAKAAWVGSVRYQHNAMPTSYGFTGQRSDGSGLDYFNARYYDPALGQFTSADTMQGLNRYGYVGGNPETLTDPNGQMACTKIMVDGICNPGRIVDGTGAGTDGTTGRACSYNCSIPATPTGSATTSNCPATEAMYRLTVRRRQHQLLLPTVIPILTKTVAQGVVQNRILLPYLHLHLIGMHL